MASVLVRSFEDLSSLEEGEAREYIPTDLLDPPEFHWLCKLTRSNKVRKGRCCQSRDEHLPTLASSTCFRTRAHTYKIWAKVNAFY